MKYVQPYGITDEDASYINGDPSVGRMGSIPPAAAFEHPMRELVGVIETSKLLPDEADLLQVAKGMRSQRANYVEDTGIKNNLTVALDPPLTTYSIGLPLRVKVAVSNDGPASIDAGAGRVQIKKPTGAAVGIGDLPAAGLIELVYDGTGFQMINFGGAGGGLGDVYYVNIPYCVDSGTKNALIANFSPPVTEIHAGTIIMVKIKLSNDAGATINVNGLGPKPIYAMGGNANYPLLPCDLAKDDVVVMMYDGSVFWVAPNPRIDITTYFWCANTTMVNQVFTALGRKVILNSANVIVMLTEGVFTPFVTYHPNADRILVSGTMKAAAPTFADFHKTGSTEAARAQDSANNIAMLRTRYGTEIQFQNNLIGVGALWHIGPGRISFQDILLVGSNVYAGAAHAIMTGAGCGRGSTAFMQNVTVWGCGSSGLSTSGGTLELHKCYATSCWTQGSHCNAQGLIVMSQCGLFGNDISGAYSEIGGMIVFYSRTGIPGAEDVGASQVMGNGDYGILAVVQSNIQGKVTVTGNGGTGGGADVMAYDMSMVHAAPGSVFGSVSPAANVEGNYNSLVKYAP